MRRLSPGPRGAVLAAIAAGGLWAAWELGLTAGGLVPSEGGLEIARELLARALSPALDYEGDFRPERALLFKVLDACRTTVIFAAAAISLALVLGTGLGVLASSTWWAGEPAAGEPTAGGWLRRRAALFAHGATRALIAFLRSVHELLWAVLFLAAFGLSDLSAVFAITLPYTGTLAKVFSELLDEAPREAAAALRSTGASPLQVFLFGLLPQALPDMAAYAFYRFECALRSSAVLGFFGYPTLGFYIAASFENLHYGEVWTYLWALVALVAVVDLWSGALRRSLLA